MKKPKLLSAAVLLFLSFSLSCSLFFSGPSSTVKSFLREVEKGEIEKSMELISDQTKGMWGNKLRAYLTDVTAKIKAKGGISSIQIDKEEVTGEVGMVAGSISFKDGSKEAFQYQLTKEKGSWKMLLK